MIERSSIDNALRNEIQRYFSPDITCPNLLNIGRDSCERMDPRYALEDLKQRALEGLEVAARSGLAFSERQSDLLAKVSGSNVKHWIVQSDRMRHDG